MLVKKTLYTQMVEFTAPYDARRTAEINDCRDPPFLNSLGFGIRGSPLFTFRSMMSGAGAHIALAATAGEDQRAALEAMARGEVVHQSKGQSQKAAKKQTQSSALAALAQLNIQPGRSAPAGESTLSRAHGIHTRALAHYSLFCLL